MTSDASEPGVIALIPARAGSKRIPGKNVQRLEGHPLLAYTVAAATASGVFSSIVVSTDSEAYAGVARYYGAEVPFLRPTALAGDLSADIDWVEYTLGRLRQVGRNYRAFSLLRVTSPFRQPETIQRAWKVFDAAQGVESLRAVERCRQHPGKMWVRHGQTMTPLLPFHTAQQPWHSSPYQALPEIYAQNASLEIALTSIVFEKRSIAGDAVIPFVSEGHEGFDLNSPLDWVMAETLLRTGAAQLPVVQQPPLTGDDDSFARQSEQHPRTAGHASH